MHTCFETRVWYVSCLYFWGIVYIYMFCYNEEIFRMDTPWRIKSREGTFFRYDREKHWYWGGGAEEQTSPAGTILPPLPHCALLEGIDIFLGGGTNFLFPPSVSFPPDKYGSACGPHRRDRPSSMTIRRRRWTIIP